MCASGNFLNQQKSRQGSQRTDPDNMFSIKARSSKIGENRGYVKTSKTRKSNKREKKFFLQHNRNLKKNKNKRKTCRIGKIGLPQSKSICLALWRLTIWLPLEMCGMSSFLKSTWDFSSESYSGSYSGSFPKRAVLTCQPLSDITHGHFLLVIKNVTASLTLAPRSW